MNFRRLILPLITVFSLAGCHTYHQNSDSLNGDDSIDMKEVTYYKNPIIYADCPDPSVVRDGEKIYVYGTSGRVYRIDNFEDGPLQLSNVRRTKVWGPSASNIWAPDVYKIGNKWNYYYANSAWGTEETCGIGVMTSDSLEGPWEDKGEIFNSTSIGVMNSIDSVVIEDNGHIYMAWGSFRGIYIIELNEDGTSLKNPETAYDDKILIAGIVGNWNGATYEGSYIRKIGEYYYFFGSQGTCCDGVRSSYLVKVAKSTSLFGPYADSKGVDMLGEDRGELVIQGDQNVAGPGHMSLMEDDEGTWWMFYHGYVKKDNASTGRVVFMDKLQWDKNGFPYVTSHKPTFDKTMKGPVLNKN